MKLLVTGATGFLGQYVVPQLLQQGYQVRAIIRPKPEQKPLSWSNHPNVELVAIDLKQSAGLIEVLGNIDGVIHLAATKSGDFNSQMSGTVDVTKNLLNAMKQAKVNRLVAISSFSVFDYLRIPLGQTITEDSLLESDPTQRDAYAQTKLIQEQLLKEFQQNHNSQVTILRPGVIYGRDNLWNARLGIQVNDKLWILIGSQAQIPVTYVENCAEAIVKAVECEKAFGQILNIVDDDLPTQKTYIEQLKKYLTPFPITLFISWEFMSLLANIASPLHQFGKLKLPSILLSARLQARFKPLCYSNIRAKHILNWQPKYSLETALERSLSSVDLLAVSEFTS